MPGQHVWLPIFCTGVIEDLEVDASELLCPACLLTVVDLGGSQVLEVLMVRKYLHLMGYPFKVLSPKLKQVHNGQ